jgi:hypothetical protein
MDNKKGYACGQEIESGVGRLGQDRQATGREADA